MKRKLVLLVFAILPVSGMRTARPWTEKHWCDSVEEPEWPFAYQKYSSQAVETKGRVNSNLQDMRHVCETYGGESKCHICEDVEGGKIKFQLQGISWEDMAHNIPSVTDSPWSVRGVHRFDFGKDTDSDGKKHVCVLVSGRDCLRPLPNPAYFPPPPPSHPMPDIVAAQTLGVSRSGLAGRDYDYSNCTVRCWGHYGTLSASSAGWGGESITHLEANYYNDGTKDETDTHREYDGDSTVATDVWDYPKFDASIDATGSGAIGASSVLPLNEASHANHGDDDDVHGASAASSSSSGFPGMYHTNVESAAARVGFPPARGGRSSSERRAPGTRSAMWTYR